MRKESLYVCVGVIFIDDAFGKPPRRIAHVANVRHVFHVCVLLELVEFHLALFHLLSTQLASAKGMRHSRMLTQGIWMLAGPVAKVTFQRLPQNELYPLSVK